MKTIYKYILEIEKEQNLYIYKGAHILDIQQQEGKIVFWAEVDTRQPHEKHTFYIVGTGGIPYFDIDTAYYVGTVQIPDSFYGVLVWHVYMDSGIGEII